MEAPVCSVIIPTHSRPTQLVECLEALAAQDYPCERFEVIVIDDGSEPPVEGLAARFEGRLDLRVFRQACLGPAAARNAGAARARGEILAFTDDDCRPEPAWLGVLAEHLRAFPAHFVGGRTINALADSRYSAASQSILDTVYAFYNADATKAHFFASNNIGMSADAFHEIGGFDGRFRTSEDRDLCDRWLRHGGVMTYLPEARVLHAHHLDLRGFLRQHFSYGRGACRFLRARSSRGDTNFNHPTGFYRKLLVARFADRPLGRAIQGCALFVLSQSASIVGFAWERLSFGAGAATEPNHHIQLEVIEATGRAFASLEDGRGTVPRRDRSHSFMS